MDKETDNNIDQANKLGNLFNSWIRIAIIIGGAVISCAYAYYQIYENKDDVANERKERIEHEQDAEYKSDKRYKEAMEIAGELKLYIKYQEEEIVKMKQQLSYNEGYEKGKEYNEKK